MRDFVLLYVNGVRHEVRGEMALQSLSDFLRLTLRLTGTKIVCAEGDCGSCTALIGRIDGDSLRYRTITSCIQFVYQLDGVHVVTVEGLRDGSELNPIQQAMVKCHGAQCGFCTPGFVVAMAGMFEERQSLSREDLKCGLVGNLCRCTGYESILTAGESVDGATVRRLNDRYVPSAIIADLKSNTLDCVKLSTKDGRSAFIAKTLAEALRYKADHTDCIIFAGGTDLGVQINKGRRDAVDLLVINALPELCTTEVTVDAITAGACVDWTTLSNLTADTIKPFADMLGRFASPPIKNAGTIGGNIANGSPIADSMPALYVLGAKIELASVRGTRQVDLNDFFSGYKRTVMAADELISRVVIPRPAAGDVLKLYKISKRQDLDISSFTAAFLLRRNEDVIADIKVAYGGVGANIIRLRSVEEWMTGRAITEETFIEAGERAADLVKPISDVRGAAAYRSRLAANIFVKFFNDLTEGASSTAGGRISPGPPASTNGKNGKNGHLTEVR